MSFSCTICTKEYTTKDGLLEHERSKNHHPLDKKRIRTPALIRDLSPSPSVQADICPGCNKIVKEIDCWVCTKCTKKFAHKSEFCMPLEKLSFGKYFICSDCSLDLQPPAAKWPCFSCKRSVLVDGGDCDDCGNLYHEVCILSGGGVISGELMSCGQCVKLNTLGEIRDTISSAKPLDHHFSDSEGEDIFRSDGEAEDDFGEGGDDKEEDFVEEEDDDGEVSSKEKAVQTTAKSSKKVSSRGNDSFWKAVGGAPSPLTIEAVACQVIDSSGRKCGAKIKITGKRKNGALFLNISTLKGHISHMHPKVYMGLCDGETLESACRIAAHGRPQIPLSSSTSSSFSASSSSLSSSSSSSSSSALIGIEPMTMAMSSALWEKMAPLIWIRAGWAFNSIENPEFSYFIRRMGVNVFGRRKLVSLILREYSAYQLVLQLAVFRQKVSLLCDESTDKGARLYVLVRVGSLDKKTVQTYCIAAKLITGDENDKYKLSKKYVSQITRNSAQRIGISDNLVLAFESDRGSNIDAPEQMTNAMIIKCASHRLNNIVQNACKNSDVLKMVKVISKSHASINRSNKALSNFHEISKSDHFSRRLPVFHSIRWNSYFTMTNEHLKNSLHVKEALQRSVQESSGDTKKKIEKLRRSFDSISLVNVKKIREVLSSLQKASTTSQLDQFSPSHTIALASQTLKIVESLEKNPETKVLRDDIASGLKRWLSDLEENTDYHRLAFLDPRTLRFIPENLQTDIEKTLRYEISEKKSNMFLGMFRESEPIPSQQDEDDEDHGLGWLLSNNSSRQTSAKRKRRSRSEKEDADDADDEVDLYMKEASAFEGTTREDVREFFLKNAKNFPLLSEMGLEYTIPQGATALVERLISQAGHVLSVRRQKLSPTLSEILISMKSCLPVLREGENCADLAKRMLFERRSMNLPVPSLFDEGGKNFEQILSEFEKELARKSSELIENELTSLDDYASDEDDIASESDDDDL